MFLMIAECECDEEGSANGKICHQMSGTCNCKPGWEGQRCDGKKNNVKDCF